LTVCARARDESFVAFQSTQALVSIVLLGKLRRVMVL
jgi:hypothetical protein